MNEIKQINELYKVTTSPSAHKIFKILDNGRANFRRSFKKYTKSVEDYVDKNEQVFNK